MPGANKPILATLLSPKVADEFLAAYWPHRPFVAHGDPARFSLLWFATLAPLARVGEVSRQ
jgi:hypothetical protein